MEASALLRDGDRINIQQSTADAASSFAVGPAFAAQSGKIAGVSICPLSATQPNVRKASGNTAPVGPVDRTEPALKMPIL
jgi:hypothetical protein